MIVDVTDIITKLFEEEGIDMVRDSRTLAEQVHAIYQDYQDAERQRLKTVEKCGTCQGSGWLTDREHDRESRNPWPCWNCHGAGTITRFLTEEELEALLSLLPPILSEEEK
jgi:hypothetical protein